MGHVEVQVAVQPQVADGPAIDLAHLGLQLVDDLHGPDLGQPVIGAAGEGGPQEVGGPCWAAPGR